MSVPKKETAEHRQERLRKDRVRVRKWRAANREKSRTNTARWYLENREKARAYHVKRCYGFGASTLVQLLWEFQGACDYITGKPLVEGFVVEHDHSSDLVRGLANDSTNRTLGQKCGDSIPGCRARLAKLKDKNGKLAQFCQRAIPALLVTPMIEMGLSFRVTGSRASLPESKVNREHINKVNLLGLRRYLDEAEALPVAA